MNILILNGNSEKESFSKSICAAYEDAARSAGHNVTVIHIGDMQFDPVLHEGHHSVQPLEPDLVHFQENVVAAKHIVIVYPTWWGGLPAILKGLFDRSFYTGFAYRYHEKDPLWDKLLKGRSAHIITTMDAPKNMVLVRLPFSGKQYAQAGNTSVLWNKPRKDNAHYQGEIQNPRNVGEGLGKN